MVSRPSASASISAIDAACPEANVTARAPGPSMAASADSAAAQPGFPFRPYPGPPPGSPCDTYTLVGISGGPTGAPSSREVPSCTSHDSTEKPESDSTPSFSPTGARSPVGRLVQTIIRSDNSKKRSADPQDGDSGYLCTLWCAQISTIWSCPVQCRDNSKKRDCGR